MISGRIGLALLVLLASSVGCEEKSGREEATGVVRELARAARPVGEGVTFRTLSIAPHGRYWGGWFSRRTPASPPAYDPQTYRVFIGTEDRGAVEILDITEPSEPVLVGSIDLNAYGVPNGLATYRGVLAVTVEAESPFGGNVGHLLFFNSEGVLIADPLRLPGANRIRHTSDGRFVVTAPGNPSPDFTVDPEAFVSIVDPGHSVHWEACAAGAPDCNLTPSARVVSFTEWNRKKAQLVRQGVRIIGPIPENLTVAQNLNPEGLSITHDDKYAWVTFERNNAIGRIDLRKGRMDKLFALGAKDHSIPGNGFDASDRDDGINIRSWPVRSLYQPDGIEAVRLGGKSYLVTANEGDPYDALPVFGEKFRLRDLVLDPTVFPDAAALQANTALGRLNVTNMEGDLDGDGDLDEIVMLGARSFSIWRPNGKLVYDSGDDFEQITAQALPEYFNAAEDENARDARSDDRGPEPEHIETGVIDGRTFVFVNFERIGGFVTYEITDPEQPRLITYVNDRNFSVEPKAVCGERGMPAPQSCAELRDAEPEGPLFIPRRDSPIDADLLVLVHEASDTTTVFRIDRVFD